MNKVLITGGTGSFGGTMTRRLLKDDSVKEIVIFSRDETKQQDMRHRLGSDKIRFVIGDVRDIDSVKAVMRTVDTVFHAAALKQVPTGEFFPLEMVRTNILGTQNVLMAAELEDNIKKVVLLSTDKAVYPINAMGMSKAMAEKLVMAQARRAMSTKFCAIRYGNVMASRGSVIPFFVEKIKEGLPLPITNPMMTRFLLSLDEAIDLVLFTIKKGKQGDLFIKKAPAATIEDLSKALLNIFNAKNPIEIVGTRAGEKIHETLATKLEISQAEDLHNYFRIMQREKDEYEDYTEKGKNNVIKEDYTSENTTRLSIKETEELLLGLDFIQDELKK